MKLEELFIQPPAYTPIAVIKNFTPVDVWKDTWKCVFESERLNLKSKSKTKYNETLWSKRRQLFYGRTTYFDIPQLKNQ